MISQNIDGWATEADSGANAPVVTSLATPLHSCNSSRIFNLATFMSTTFFLDPVEIISLQR